MTHEGAMDGVWSIIEEGAGLGIHMSLNFMHDLLDSNLSGIEKVPKRLND